MFDRATTDPRRRTALLIAVPVVLAALVALVLSLMSTAQYRATAGVVIGEGATLDTELAVASGSKLVAEVRALVGDGPELSVEASGGEVLEFEAGNSNADNAATAANAYAEAYVGQSTGASLVDRATVPSDPYEPTTGRNVLLAALAGLVIGVVAAVVVSWRDGTIRSKRQLTKVSGVANLAVVPRHPLGEVRPDDVAVLRDPNSIEAEAYRTLRATLEFVAQDRPMTVLLVTSPRPGEGKSSVAANLAAVVAQAGRRVVLVDGDLRRPQVHRLFVTENEVGLSSVLDGDEVLQRCVQRVGPDRNVALLPAGPPPPDPAELLSHERLQLAIASLAGASDLVVIDAPPVLPVADPIILAQQADATLLVATAGLSERREWVETLDRLRNVGAEVVGTVLLNPDSRVRATPNYRYAPTATPANWWVNDERRGSTSPTGVAQSGGADPLLDRGRVATDDSSRLGWLADDDGSEQPRRGDGVDETGPDDAKADDRAPDPWLEAGAGDQLVWQDDPAADAEELVVVSDGESVADDESDVGEPADDLVSEDDDATTSDEDDGESVSDDEQPGG